MILKDVWVLSGNNRFSDSWCLAFDKEYRDYKTGEEITFININGAPIPVDNKGKPSGIAPKELRDSYNPISGVVSRGENIPAISISPERHIRLNDVIKTCAAEFVKSMADRGLKSITWKEFVKRFNGDSNEKLPESLRIAFAKRVTNIIFKENFYSVTETVDDNGNTQKIIKSVGQVTLANGETAIFTDKSRRKFVYSSVSKNPRNIYALPYLVRVLSCGKIRDDPNHHVRGDDIESFYEVYDTVYIRGFGKCKVYINVGRTKNYNLVYNFGIARAKKAKT